ncbi:MAG: MBL fold metallo-hydrolase [Gammaproteobacteria bacterium]
MLARVKKSLSVAAVAMTVATLSTPVQAHSKLPVSDVEGSLSVMVLGSGGPQLQASGRASAGYLVFADGQPFALMDLGSGTYKSLAMSGAHVGQLNYILLSHLHIDHASEVPGVIKGIYFDGQLQGKQHVAPFQIYGPQADTNGMFPSTSQLMDGYFAQGTGLFRYLRRFVGGVDGYPDIIGKFGYQAHDLSAAWQNEPPISTIVDTTVDNNELVIKDVAVDHLEAPAVAYRIDYKGHSVVYTGDTHSTTDNIIRLAQGADVLIYDTSILDNVPNPMSPFWKRHTTPKRIGEVAVAAGVKTLVLSHLTPASAPNIDSIITEIQAQGFTGKIKVAKDLRVYNTDD